MKTFSPAKAAFVIMALSIALSATAPVQAAGLQIDFGNGHSEDHDRECLSQKRSMKALKRQKFFNIEPLVGVTPPEGQFAFYASKKMRNGEVHPFHIYYDACERVIISASDEQ